MSPLVALALTAAGVAFVALDVRSLQRSGEYENRPARALKLLSVLLLTLLVVVDNPLLPRHPAIDPAPLRVAFVFTLLGDVAFRVIGKFLLGVGLFAVVQLIYAWRHAHGLELDLADLGAFAFAAALSGGVYLKMHPGMGGRGLRAPVGAYIAICGLALWAAIVQHLHGRFPDAVGARILVGTALFTSCDIAIGARIVLTGRRKQVAGLIVWVFYLPALALLAWTAP
ncbi:MAG: hypothetical protein H6711_14740 [Myxococcales bacterium]|nr:hypothetical protein [Myxococcales bacterium]